MYFRLFCILFILFSQTACAQKRSNRYKHLQRQGKWIVYQDSTKMKIDNVGRYRKGIPKSIWKYYDANGKLNKKEKYCFKKIYTTYFHPNGKIKKQGKAKIVQEEKTLHFFYYDDWNVYDSLGTLVRKEKYVKGLKISEINYTSKTERNINDSLVAVLRNINANIYTYFDSISIAEKMYGKSSGQYQRAVLLNTLNSSQLLAQLDAIILKFGYPGKSMVGKEYTIAFSIISTANIKYKEKHYDIILKAADDKELDWSDVAFFVDKVHVAKKQNQIYGTQYIIEEKYNQLFYPIDDIEKLNERRKKVGLDELNISELSFTTSQ